MRARLVRLLALGALVVAVSACSVDATVTVRMRDDGSGTVTVRVALDRGAVAVLTADGTALADAVRLDDLAGAGWSVGRWRATAGGGAVLRIAKPFSRPEQVAGIVAELNGERGPLRRVRAARDASRFSTRWSVDGVVDLRSVGVGVGDDPELAAALAAARVDPAVIEARLVGRALGGLRVALAADLPDGPPDAVAATPGRRGVLAATRESTATGRILLVVAGAVAGALAVVVLALAFRRRRRPRRIPVRSPAP